MPRAADNGVASNACGAQVEALFASGALGLALGVYSDRAFYAIGVTRTVQKFIGPLVPLNKYAYNRTHITNLFCHS